MRQEVPLRSLWAPSLSLRLCVTRALRLLTFHFRLNKHSTNCQAPQIQLSSLRREGSGRFCEGLRMPAP